MRSILLLRAALVTAGGQVLVSAGAIAAVGGFLRDALLCRRVRPLSLVGATAALGYQFVAKPWMRSWGASPAETKRVLPGDELVPEPRIQITHAVTIAAPVERVWPWLAQIGQDRGGFYSFEWLENLAGCEMRNADRVHPEWQERQVGEPVPLHPAAPGLPVTIFEPGRVIGLEALLYRLRSSPRHPPFRHAAKDAAGDQGSGRGRAGSSADGFLRRTQAER